VGRTAELILTVASSEGLRPSFFGFDLQTAIEMAERSSSVFSYQRHSYDFVGSSFVLMSITRMYEYALAHRIGPAIGIFQTHNCIGL
jgi:hypothetical protein